MFRPPVHSLKHVVALSPDGEFAMLVRTLTGRNSMSNWNEENRIWEADHGLLDDDQIAKCVRADEGALFPSPVPTRMISNGEYMPAPQTEKQKRVEARLTNSRSPPAGSWARSPQIPSGDRRHGRCLHRDERSVRAFFRRRPDGHVRTGRLCPGGRRAICSSSTISSTWFAAASALRRRLRALAQGPRPPGFKAIPLTREICTTNAVKSWGVWNPALLGLPITRGERSDHAVHQGRLPRQPGDRWAAE